MFWYKLIRIRSAKDTFFQPAAQRPDRWDYRGTLKKSLWVRLAQQNKSFFKIMIYF